jgi:hypothetical protein
MLDLVDLHRRLPIFFHAPGHLGLIFDRSVRVPWAALILKMALLMARQDFLQSAEVFSVMAQPGTGQN